MGGGGATLYLTGSILLNFLGFSPWASSTFAYICLIPIIYSIQRRFVFKSDESHKKAFPRYVLIQVIGIGFSAFIPFFLDKFGINSVASFIFVVALIAIVNYTLQLFWAFKKTN